MEPWRLEVFSLSQNKSLYNRKERYSSQSSIDSIRESKLISKHLSREIYADEPSKSQQQFQKKESNPMNQYTLPDEDSNMDIYGL